MFSKMRSKLAKMTIFAALSTMAFSAGSAFAQEEFSVGGYFGALPDVPMLVAKAEGYFNEEGLDVDILNFANAPAAFAALQGGSVNAVPSGSNLSMLMNSRVTSGSNSVKMIYAHQPGSSWAVLVGDEIDVDPKAGPVDIIAKLKGKNIGVPGIGSEGQAIMDYLLEAAGLNPKADVTYLGVGLGPQALGAFETGQISAIIVFSPVTVLIEERGGKIAFDTTNPAHLTKENGLDLFSKWSFAVYSSTQAQLSKEPEKYAKFLRALDKAITMVRDPDMAERVVEIWSEANPALSKKQLAAALEIARSTFTGRIDCEAVDNTAAFGVSSGQLDASAVVPCSDLVWEGAKEYVLK